MTVEARWRCATCGGFVAGESVTVVAGVPRGKCPRDCSWTPATTDRRVRVLYERTSSTPHERDERPVGEDANVLDFTDVARETFLDVVRRLDPGTRFSVNTLRSRLDALEVPPGKRGGLFECAVHEGLATPLWVDSGATRVQAREPSTGRSAKRATVRLYERTRPE